MAKTHNHAFFVFGVIVGLAIREALTRVVPHVLPVIVDAVASQPADSKGQLILEAARLITFLTLIIRFYLGAGMYFDKVYCSEKLPQGPPHNNYGLDFLMGTIHFIILFVWSETIIVHNRFTHGMSGFLALLGIVLLYDLVWWAMSSGYDTVKTIRRWALLNLASVVLGFLILVVLNFWQITSDRTAEALSLLPIGFFTLVDFGEMFGGENIITATFLKIFGSPV
jgi:hypothetical protein